MAALFGARLRRLRTQAGLTQAELGRGLHVVGARIAQIERATGHKPTAGFARLLDEKLGTDDLFTDLWPHVSREAFPDWSRRYTKLSDQATAKRQYAAHVVPGLLQTEDYARALLQVGRTLTTQEQLDERLAARMSRHSLLDDPGGLDLWVVLDESVLRRAIGGKAVVRAQFTRLLEKVQGQHVTVQVLPFSSGEHAALGGSLTLLTLPDGSDVAYTEGAETGQLVEEPEDVRTYSATYERLRALAFPPRQSAELIRAAMQEIDSDSGIPPRSERRRLAKVQLQQSRGGQLRRVGVGGRISHRLP
ncbi:helix-turn-helix domain-containing protein [Streptomyces winkii]|uniref:helix-turn-helix domain-containing protein n=1 Tax=Streptomyces winkii TaxID=3051178 RepID=UPI0037DA099B